jgi:hypothetical protein
VIRLVDAKQVAALRAVAPTWLLAKARATPARISGSANTSTSTLQSLKRWFGTQKRGLK